MSLLRRLLLITFIESFACILVERGIYFFCRYRLAFSAEMNLWLAFAFGAAYVAGALASHSLSGRWTEKRVLTLTIVCQVAMHVTLAASPTAAVVFVASTLIGYLNGAKWPVIESYVSAGQTPAATARAVGLFNIAWAVAVPPSIVIVGPLIHPYTGLSGPLTHLLEVSLFLLAAAMNISALLLLAPLKPRPVHTPHDHPQRPSAEGIRRLRGMLGFSRWTMFFSYASMFAMAALMPAIFDKNLRLSEIAATALSGVLDLMRLTAFVVLQRTSRWHSRWAPLILAMLAAPMGFVLVVSGASVAVVVAGEIVFGLAAGMIYYAALYYAMVVQNASVDAGGAHEGLIGLGFAVGPLACLAGAFLSPALGGQQTYGLLVGVTPLFAMCTAGAIVQGRRFRDATANPTPSLVGPRTPT